MHNMHRKSINIEQSYCPFQKEKYASEDLFYAEDIDTEDSFIYEEDAIEGGDIYFGEHNSETKHKPFMLATEETSVDHILNKLTRQWNLSLPNLVLFIISSCGETTNMLQEHRDLQKLLVKELSFAQNTSEMWIFTSGLNEGFNIVLGTAVNNDLARRRILTKGKGRLSRMTFPETALIGICNLDDLKISESITLTSRSKEKTRHNVTADKEVNEYFDNFIFLADHTKENIDKFFIEFAKKIKDYTLVNTELSLESGILTQHSSPVITMLVHGKVSEIYVLKGYLKHGIPLVIIEGSGGLADLIAFAYRQISQKPIAISLAEYTEAVLKPLLSEKFGKLFASHSDQKTIEQDLVMDVFSCLQYSSQRDRDLITIVDRYDLESKSHHLQSNFIEAFFKSQSKTEKKDIELLRQYLFLAIVWNTPNVVKSDILREGIQFHVDNETFCRAIVQPGREEFVSLFLSQGFKVHKFLHSNTLLILFQSSMKREFFRGIIWEIVLGLGSTVNLSRYFIDNKICNLLEKLTSLPNLIHSYMLDRFYDDTYEGYTPEEAERKVRIVLILWATLSFRIDLVKIIWRYSEQPVHLAIISSLIIFNLQPYVVDLSLKEEMNKQSTELSKMAIKVFSKCYDLMPLMARDLLCEKNKFFSYKSLIEIAAFAKNKEFMSHESCQKYLDEIFMGNIEVTDLRFGEITLPQWLKICLSTFFFFPMFLWIKFKSKNDGIYQHKTSNNRSKFKRRKDRSEKVNFFKKIYYLYTAPISKFWMHEISHFIYLFIFSLAVIWPSCGNFLLDAIVCFWTLIIIINQVHQVVSLQQKYPSMSVKYKIIDSIILTAFLICYVMNRLTVVFKFLSPYEIKGVLCLILLYAYYKVIFISFPVSSELGTLLNRIQRMIRVDFLGFMRFAILVMISNGIVLHAIIYPDYPMNKELLRKIVLDTILIFFTLNAEHFGVPDNQCVKLKRHPNGLSFVGLPEDTCQVGRYFKPECPNPGIWPYLFGFQFAFILKIILLTLLYVLYKYTQNELDETGTYMWKYQRYDLVMEFRNRFALPAPLSPICYITHLIGYVNNSLFQRKVQMKSNELTEEDFNIWRKFSEKTFDENLQKSNEDNTSQRRKYIAVLKDKINNQRNTMVFLKGYLSDIQIQVKSAYQFLANNPITMSIKERVKMKDAPQLFSRISPYPFTHIFRFPVPDHHVSWSNSWTFYDPITYTMPKADFPKHLQSFVDFDMQMQVEKEDKLFAMPDIKWNKYIVSTTGICFDRRSWIIDIDFKTIQYDIDTDGLPINPVGRTGLRGKGSLLRWGPNHFVYCIITKWNETDFVPHHSYLEVVLVIDDNELKLPGGYVLDENFFKSVSSTFNHTPVFDSEDNMISYFDSLAEKSKEKVKLADDEALISDTETEDSITNDLNIKETDLEEHFTYSKVWRGYFDESTNTDQAWCEAEIWHLHYNVKCHLETRFKADTIWTILNEDILTKVPIRQAKILYNVAKRMKAAMEVM